MTSVEVAVNDRVPGTPRRVTSAIEASRLHAGFLLAGLMAIAVAVWLFRSRHGWETRAAGLSPEAAHAMLTRADGRLSGLRREIGPVIDAIEKGVSDGA